MCAWLTPACPVTINRPIRVPRMTLLNRQHEFERHLQLAANKCGEQGWILILLDADDDRPVALAATLRERSQRVVPHRPVAVVLANREFEAWFMAAAESLNGCHGLKLEPGDQNVHAETPRDAKGWLGRRLGNSRYHATSDQPKFAAKFDMAQARQRSRSFRKLCDDWMRHTSTYYPRASPSSSSDTQP
ncbi:uncharacterized protein DUF4276 [Sphaerotilus mobilis]|uniref:Uncharacterized protein DUF4276 n=2 Tax=Sphaerotilus mobilis TaxID=47994 RepID=A0A4V2EVR4_9BURK|nr:DUF4276 family protein [Sphaerotilus mobilis]RZS53400.1 uncharacterized protein DUF4276 [Sphaerotilus mobilis]